MKIFFKNLALIVLAVLVFGYGAKNILAQDSQSTLYVPLMGISLVPEPLALSKGPGTVTYHYAVKNFLKEAPLSNVQVTDDTCSPVTFTEGDDNGDSELEFNETWRYVCSMKLSATTESTATATGNANDMTAMHKAYATVVVGSQNPPPLVSIVNITKVAYPLTLSSQGGDITFTYRVNNPGAVALSNISVTDDKCSAMSSKLGDTNGNNLLDTTEVWVYTCKTHLSQTTTNTVSVVGYANGLRAVGYATLTVTVAAPVTPGANSSPGLPNTGDVGVSHFKIIIWGVLSGLLIILIIFFFLRRRTQ